MAQASFHFTSYQPTGGKCEVCFFFSFPKCLFKKLLFIYFNWRCFFTHAWFATPLAAITQVAMLFPPSWAPSASLSALLLQVITDHWLWVPRVTHQICTGFLSFSYGKVYVSMLSSQISPSPTESQSLFFPWLSPLLPYTWDHWHHLSRFHVHMWQCYLCLSLSDLLHTL